MPISSDDLSDAAASAFKQLLSEGLRVLLHKRLDSAGGRITRVRRVMMLTDGVLRFCTTEGDTLVDEGEGFHLLGHRLRVRRPVHEQRSPLAALAPRQALPRRAEQSKRMLSLLGQGRSIDVEVRLDREGESRPEAHQRPRGPPRRRTRRAARHARCSGLPPRRAARCRDQMSDSLPAQRRSTRLAGRAPRYQPMSAYAELIRVDVRNGAGARVRPARQQFPPPQLGGIRPGH